MQIRKDRFHRFRISSLSLTSSSRDNSSLLLSLPDPCDDSFPPISSLVPSRLFGATDHFVSAPFVSKRRVRSLKISSERLIISLLIKSSYFSERLIISNLAGSRLVESTALFQETSHFTPHRGDKSRRILSLHGDTSDLVESTQPHFPPSDRSSWTSSPQGDLSSFFILGPIASWRRVRSCLIDPYRFLATSQATSLLVLSCLLL